MAASNRARVAVLAAPCRGATTRSAAIGVVLAVVLAWSSVAAAFGAMRGSVRFAAVRTRRRRTAVIAPRSVAAVVARVAATARRLVARRARSVRSDGTVGAQRLESRV